MRRWKVYVLTSLVACLFLPAYMTAKEGKKSAKSKEFVGLDISVPERPSYKIPIPLTGTKTAVLPIKSATVNGIKIAPRLEGDLVKFDVLAVLDPLEDVKSCDQLKSLKTQLLASYSGKVGDIIRLTELEKFSPTPVKVTIAKMVVNNPGGDCCVCGALSCCPNPGKCFDHCGTCGMCCMGT
jgi:hypothetical protein